MAYLRYYIVLLLLLFIHHELPAKTLHAIFVADTIHEIRTITQPDLKRWKKEVRLISTHADIPLKEKIFCDGDYDKEKITRYLRGLRIEKEDLVIFYFSGHGYRTRNKATPWPFLTIDFYKQGLDVHWVLSVIRNKKPKFALIISDCCNNYMEDGMFGEETKNVVIKLKPVLPNPSGYAHLFGRAKGCVVISSCSQGQFSYGSRLGGLYTQCFFSSLNRELNEKTPSWKNLLQRTNGLIQHIQQPICEVYR